MSLLSRLAAGLFRGTLALYPPGFRREYADELYAVFSLALHDAERRGLIGLIAFCAHELRDIPGALWRAHRRGWADAPPREPVPAPVRERRAMQQRNVAALRAEPLAGWSGAAVFAPFAWIAVIESVGALVRLSPAGIAVGGVLGVLVTVGVLALAVAGLAKRLPAWTLPSLGLVLAAANWVLLGVLMVALNLALNLSPLLALRPAPYSWGAFAHSGLVGTLSLLPLLVLTGILVLLSATLPAWRPTFRRLRQDWSQVSLLLYASYLLSPVISFDPPDGAGYFQVLNLVLLAAGAWLYLRTSGPWRRLAILMAAATLAQCVVQAGEFRLYADAARTLSAALDGLFAQGQIVSVVGSVLPLAIPALLALRPRSMQPAARVPDSPLA